MAVEWSVVEHLLGNLYGTLDGSVPWEEAMAGFAEASRCERVSLISVGADRAVRQDGYPFDPAGVVEFVEHYADRDRRISRIMGEKLRGLLTTQDLMTAEEIARCPVHNEFYRKYPECWNTMAFASEVEGEIFIPAVQRGAGMGAFDEDERRLFAAMAGHLVRISYLERRLPSGGLSSDGIVAAMDGIEDGVLIFDEAGQVVHMNAAARGIVAAKDGLELHNRLPVASHPASRFLLSRMITEILLVAADERIEMPASLTLPRPRGQRPLRVRGFVAPPQDGHRRLGILMVQREGEWRIPTVDALRAVAGLTVAEARAARALLEGAGPRDYATRSGLSEHTVRFQMKRIREKLGVNRQAAIVSTLMRLCASG